MLYLGPFMNLGRIDERKLGAVDWGLVAERGDELACGESGEAR